MERTLKRTITLALAFANDIFFADESDEDTEKRENIIEISDFCEEIVPRMNNQQFQMHFRLKPETFEIMLQLLHGVELHDNKPGRPAITLEKDAMITLWYLANLESFRSVASRFGITKSTCWNAVYRTCKSLLKMNKQRKLIAWPSYEQALHIMNNFERRHGLPGVLGAIDGSHIPIVAPKQYHVSYINRKDFHSVLLQGVCDSKLCFIDVYAGQPGSMHDWTLFRKSDLYRRIINNEVEFPQNGHLIGDLAYALEENLLVGFKDYGNLSHRQKNFNVILSKTRAVIENAFGLLKGRFRRLKSLETVRMDLISLLIVAACIVHNFCILSDDVLENLLNVEAEAEEERRNNPQNMNNHFDHAPRNNNAIVKRSNIMNNLPLIIRDI